VTPVRAVTVLLACLLAGCAAGPGSGDRIGSLRTRTVDITDTVPRDSLERAMQSYRAFLEETPESEMTPEALRRLADLKIQRGVIAPDAADSGPARTGARLDSPILARSGQRSDRKTAAASNVEAPPGQDAELAAIEKRSKRPVAQGPVTNAIGSGAPTSAAEQQMLQERADSAEAIRLYRKLLDKYPDYERRDQVLYQLARAYGIRGEQDKAMDTLNRLVHDYPYSQHFVEAQFRRGEILFVRKQYREAEKAYADVVEGGPGSGFYDQALYKQGWSRFKQSRYRDALDSFVALIDKNAPAGREMIASMDESQQKRMQDTLRVVSFSFSYLGGPQVIGDYFARVGRRAYVDMIYGDLGEHYLEKERYADAANTFALFVKRNPLHDRAPEFQKRVIDVYEKGGFPKLVIEAKKTFAKRYAPDSQYWQVHDLSKNPKTLAFIKTNLTDLAKHYHALSQHLDKPDERKAAAAEAINWYREFLTSFPDDKQAPKLNLLLADLLYDNGRYREAAQEYTTTAYDYGKHDRASEAGFAAVQAYEKLLEGTEKKQRGPVERRLIKSSLQFAETFPDHPKAPQVLGAAATRLFQRDEYKSARDTATKLVKRYPQSERELRRSAWVVTAHSEFALEAYPDAEQAYRHALSLIGKGKEQKKLEGELTERLAASIYEQGAAARDAGNLDKAVTDFLRVGTAAPGSPIRETAEYDAAAALIQLKAWDRAADVLQAYRNRYPDSKRRDAVTKKLAVVFEKGGRLAEAAAEYERIENKAKDPELQRQANIHAAELYEKVDRTQDAIAVYERYVRSFPEPVEYNVETRHRLAELYAKTGQQDKHEQMLQDIVAADASAGQQRTPRTRYLAAKASLELAEPMFEKFKRIKLALPLKQSLARKKEAMQAAIDRFQSMVDYGVAEVTSAATYYLGELYHDFTRALLHSERPKGLSKLEKEQYEILLEERAYPFEEKAINIHQKNIELIQRGVYNDWIQKSISQLGELVPARYAKQEVSEPYVAQID